MTRAFPLAAVALAVAASGGGCVTCHHEAAEAALAAGPQCTTPTCERNKVHVFLINGLTPTGSCGLSGLRDKLGRCGFAKVGYGQIVHGWWAAEEMKSIHADDPDARFVLVGYDVGCGEAVRVTNQVRRAGVPVEAVVLLAPVGRPAAVPGVRTLLVTSGAGRSPVPHTESVIVADANHFNLPTHPQTVAAVSGLLNDLAVAQMKPYAVPLPACSYEHAPAPRPSSLPAGNSWDFLHERPADPPMKHPAEVVTPKPAPSPANIARNLKP
jgi:hypothetical protein